VLKNGYIGQTRKRPYTKRIEEHRKLQPWGDLIVDSEVLWESDSVSDFWLTMMEMWYIKTRRPFHNDQLNRSNSRRIPAAVAKKQAAARGRKVGVAAAASAPGARVLAGSGDGSFAFASVLLLLLTLAGMKYLNLI
jgi:hypothetical protein